MPLQFNRDKQQILLKNGTRVPIPGTFVDDPAIVEPKGSTWAMVSALWVGPGVKYAIIGRVITQLSQPVMQSVGLDLGLGRGLGSNLRCATHSTLQLTRHPSSPT